jgi:outer membrane protein TolC
MLTTLLLAVAMTCMGQAPTAPPTTQKPTTPPGGVGHPAAAPGSPVTINLSDALQRAREYSQQYLAANIAVSLAHEDRVQARAAQLPSLNYFNQYIYTQGNATPTGVFVANNGVHIYNSQAVVHEELSYTLRAEYRRSLAAEAVARARQAIAARGLVSTVVQSYYGLITAQRHLVNAQRSLDEARRFVDITQKQEQGGEVAHADVVKAQLQLQQRERDLMEAQLAVEKAKVALGVVLFADVRQEYNITDDLQTLAALPPFDEIQTRALQFSPELRGAQAALQQAGFGISVARGAYIPSLVLDYFFGIDSNVVALKDPDGRRNYGSAAQGTVTLPVWNWGALRSKVRQAELQQRQAQLDLQFTQRLLLASLGQFYLEAQSARAQLESLRSSLDLATESLRLTILRYQGGEATALEVVDAQTSLAQARNAYDDGLARYRVVLAALQTLTGTL